MTNGVTGRPAYLGAAELGRQKEWQVIREAVEAVERSGSLVRLVGSPGMGKSVLLEQAGELAADLGLRVLRANAAESERDLPFAVLHQLTWPLVRDEPRTLPSAGRAALERALHIGSADTSATCTVAAATLDLLTVVSRRQPLALLIDDLHWTDASSAEVLDFVQRRVAALPVVVLVTVRADEAVPLDSTGIEVLRLPSVTEEGAERLLRALHPELSDVARRRITREAAGNPLALTELPAQLGEAQRVGGAPLPEHLPLGNRLEGMFAARLRALPPAARSVLLLCAVADRDGQSLGGVSAAARAAGVDDARRALSAAEESGLVRVDDAPARVRFRHPLVRSALVTAATGAERRQAHAAWARVLPAGDLRQVMHRADATVLPDEEVARALEEAAQVAQSRGGDVEAVRLLARAAGMSTSDAARGHRLAAAACTAVRAGHLDLAGQYVEQALAQGVPPASRGMLDFARSHVRMQGDGDLGPAIDLLPGVLDRITGREAEALRSPCLFLLFMAAAYSGDAEVWMKVARLLDGDSDLERLGHDVWRDPARLAQGGAERFEAALRGSARGEQAAEGWLLLWSAVGLDMIGDHSGLWEELAHRHSYATQNFVAAVCAYDDYLAGRWDRCVRRARDAARAARVRGFHLSERIHWYKEGYVTAARGQRQAVDDLVAVLRPWAAERGITLILLRLRAMEAMCALALGDYEAAYTHACAVTPPGTLPVGVAQFHLVFLDLVEAAVYTGRYEEARRHVAAGRAARMERISAHHEFLLLSAEAMVSHDTDAACAAVYTCSHASRWPFELARVRLHHGAWLRRQGRRSEARAQLESARRAFAVLKAAPWADRARQELRVCNEASGRGTATYAARAGLTHQESRIATLVADGLSNRDIGARLQLSPKTVANHLSRIYPKLGVTTRAAVARALAEDEA
ncbi:LuxR family transcriptional regulator [Streptomyces sp. CC219B]|uniref:ATP-binding protein n=1 Tax=Streptomyces sp. CC219B TaxID=3044574 RepID=UPI0024A8CC6D|nr:LuxR family transcriptional regulator [Streptomyces sp. CC219B]